MWGGSINLEIMINKFVLNNISTEFPIFVKRYILFCKALNRNLPTNVIFSTQLWPPFPLTGATCNSHFMATNPSQSMIQCTDTDGTCSKDSTKVTNLPPFFPQSVVCATGETIEHADDADFDNVPPPHFCFNVCTAHCMIIYHRMTILSLRFNTYIPCPRRVSSPAILDLVKRQCQMNVSSIQFHDLWMPSIGDVLP